MAKLIQNPNSTNKFYVPQSRFPYSYVNHRTTMGLTLNNDGTINIQFDRAGTSNEYIFPAVSADVLSSFIDNSEMHLFIGVEGNLLGSGFYFHPRVSVGNRSFEPEQHSLGSYAGGRIVYYSFIAYDEIYLRELLSKGNYLTLCPIIQPSGADRNNAHLSLCIGTTPPSSWESAYTVVPTYTVTYRDPSGTNANVTHRNIDKGSATPAAPAWTRTGYRLTGWNPARASTVTANVTYSAVWTANTYQIEWVDPSGTNSTVTNSATYGSTTPTPPTWTRPGYELVGWTPELAETVTESVTYQAIWLAEGVTQSPVTLSQARVWADANGYQSGTALAEADKMLFTFEQLSSLSSGGLPDGYTELEYVEGTGTQYIDTGFAASGDTRVVCKFAVDYIDPTTVGSCPVYGASTNYNVNAFEFWSLSYGFASYDNQNYQDGFGLQANVVTVVDQNKNVVTVGGVQKSFRAATFTTPYTMLVFATHRADGIKIADSTQNPKIYEMQIYDNGTQVRGFVPAKRDSDGAVGMYDTIGGTFYGNSGTGEFVAGPDVQTGDPMAADGSEYVTLEQFKEWANSRVGRSTRSQAVTSTSDGTRTGASSHTRRSSAD